MPLIPMLGAQAAGQAVGAGMGLLLQGANNRQQIKQQQKLTDMQIAAQKQMGIFNREQQMQLWNDTNYAAQKEQMKKAGLSPGLMYGTSGGGATTASAIPGNVSAPQAGKNTESLGMGLQMGQAQMMAAQIELTKAQTEKTKAEIPKVGAETDLVKQNIKNAESQQQYTEAMTAWQNLETKFAGDSYENRQKQIATQLEQTIATVKQIGLANNFTEATWNAAIAQIEKNVIQTELHNQLLEVQKRSTEKGIQLQQTQINKMTEDIAQGWEKLRLEGLQGQRETVKLEQTNLDLLIKQIQMQFNTSHPGLWNVIGGTVEETIKKTAKDIYEKIKNVVPKL